MTSTNVSPAPIRRGVRRATRRTTGFRSGRDAYGYLRVSTNQSSQLSLPDQQVICERAAEAAGYTIVGWYQDEKPRGAYREGLHAMLDDVQTADAVGAIFFWQASRLWGHTEQMRRIQYTTGSVGVRLIDGAGKEWKSDTPMETLFNLLQGGLNEFETNVTSERIHNTHMEKAARGQLIQRPPFGIKVVRTVSADGAKLDRTFVVDEAEMALVREAFQKYADGESAFRIAKSFADRGFKTQRGAILTAVNVRRMLDNKLYNGVMVWNKTKTFWEIDDLTGDKFKEIGYRSEEEYVTVASPLGVILAPDPQNVQQVADAQKLFAEVEQMRNMRGRRRERIYPLRVLAGLVKCGRCGYTMQGRRFGNSLKDGSRSNRWDFRCQHATSMNKGCTKSHTMSERKIYKKIEQLLAAEAGADAVTTVKPVADEALGDVVRRAQREQQKAREAVERIRTLVRRDDFTDFYDSLDDAMAEMRLARTALEAANTVLEEAQRERGAGEAPPERLSDSRRKLLLETVRALQEDGLDLDIKRRLAQDAFEVIVVDSPSVEVRFR